jgi:hypothetical protein
MSSPANREWRLIFDRALRRTGKRATPGRFRTRVITEGVTPSLHVDYKHATIKQYRKEGRALRTETTINNTRDFQIGKRLTNLPALREIGFSANRRLLGVQQLSHDPITGTQALAAVTDPITTPAGTRVAGLRFTDQRSHALLTTLPIFKLQPHGFANNDHSPHNRVVSPPKPSPPRIRAGATAVSTANSSSSGSTSPPPPSGRSSKRPGSTQHPSARPVPGPTSSAPKPTPSSPATSSKPSP